MNLTDTILAISSPPSGGASGTRGIVRLSGPNAWQLAATVINLPSPPTIGWHANLVLPLLHPAAKLAATLFFQSPRSFTGQNIAELHLPNSPALLQSVLAALLENGKGVARLADPGEFSARAFFNGKIDLTQAEGIAATINASNESQLRAAASLRSGDLYKWTAATAEKIANLLASIEAGIDFVDEEDVRFITPEILHAELQQIYYSILQYHLTARRFESYTGLPTVVLTGNPNVGKSSLLNALTNSNRAIVSPIAGTTRDAIAATLSTRIGNIHLLDVAGVEHSIHPLAEKMNAARIQALESADLILYVDAPDVPFDPRDCEDFPMGTPSVNVLNKSDLPESSGYLLTDILRVSARTGEGLDLLRHKIVEILEPVDSTGAHRAILNQRHRDILSLVGETLDTADDMTRDPRAIDKYPELLAAELRRSLDLLGQITGTISPDEILGRIFSQFCIGK